MQADFKTFESNQPARKNPRSRSGDAAVWQARLIMLVMINIAQLWILAATVDAVLARHYSVLIPLVVASVVCFLITLSIIRWWRPTSRQKTSTGYVRDQAR
jgi:predicted signal transduction protein with EAL and GGDEF domain